MSRVYRLFRVTCFLSISSITPRILRNELRQGSAALLLGCAECEVAIDREHMYLQTMNKGEAQLSASQMKQLSTRTVAAEKYEDEVLDLAQKKSAIEP